MVVCLYTRSIPGNVLWWSLQAFSVAVMIFLGIWACQWRELRPMSLGGAVPKAKATPALPHELNGEDPNGNQADGVFFRMLGRVRRNTMGRGDYELASLEEHPEEGD
jgi:protein SYS1